LPTKGQQVCILPRNDATSLLFQLDQINTESRVFHVAWLNGRIDDVAGYLAIAVEIDQKKFKIPFDRNSCPLLEISSKMHRSPWHTLDHW
jgi:hypothetical protein